MCIATGESLLDGFFLMGTIPLSLPEGEGVLDRGVGGTSNSEQVLGGFPPRRLMISCQSL